MCIKGRIVLLPLIRGSNAPDSVTLRHKYTRYSRTTVEMSTQSIFRTDGHTHFRVRYSQELSIDIVFVNAARLTDDRKQTRTPKARKPLSKSKTITFYVIF